jgi:hypothetical protein
MAEQSSGKSIVTADQELVGRCSREREPAQAPVLEAPVMRHDQGCAAVDRGRNDVSVIRVWKLDLVDQVLVTRYQAAWHGAVHCIASATACLEVIRELLCDVVEPLPLDPFCPPCVTKPRAAAKTRRWPV